jgi:hypothetical protein
MSPDLYLPNSQLYHDRKNDGVHCMLVVFLVCLHSASCPNIAYRDELKNVSHLNEFICHEYFSIPDTKCHDQLQYLEVV